MKNVQLQRTMEVLSAGGMVQLPTELGPILACDADNEKAVAKLLKTGQKQGMGPLACLMAHDAMLEQHLGQVPDLAYDLMDFSTKPTLIVYDQPLHLAPQLCQGRELAILVARHKFARYAVARFKRPLAFFPLPVNTVASKKRCEEMGRGPLADVDYVVTLQKENPAAQPYAIIALGTDGSVTVIKE
ncbi:L-threonylcarbamoyladenylate synthase [Maribacter sp. 2307ULW6-5]